MGGGGSTHQQSSSAQDSGDDGLEVQGRAGGAKIVCTPLLLLPSSFSHFRSFHSL
jgi:hypothetical protein